MNNKIKPNIKEINMHNFNANQNYIMSLGQSVFSGKVIKPTPVELVFDRIKSDEWIKRYTEKIQRHVNPNVKKGLQNVLDWFSVCSFEFIRAKENFLSTSMLLFSIDSLDNVSEIKSKLSNWEHTFAVFVSVLGNGLRLIVKLNREITSISDYYAIHDKIFEHIQNTLQIQLNPITKNPCHACFMSHDPDIYINYNAIELDVNEFVSIPEMVQRSVEISARREEILSAFQGVTEENRLSALQHLVSLLLKKGGDRDQIYKSVRLWNGNNKPPFSYPEFNREFNSIYDSLVLKNYIKANKHFWVCKNGKIEINYKLVIDFLHMNNFFKLETNDKSHEYIRLQNGCIKTVSIDKIKESIYDYIKMVEIDNTNEVLNTFRNLSKECFYSNVIKHLKTINPLKLKNQLSF